MVRLQAPMLTKSDNPIVTATATATATGDPVMFSSNSLDTKDTESTSASVSESESVSVSVSSSPGNHSTNTDSGDEHSSTITSTSTSSSSSSNSSSSRRNSANGAFRRMPPKRSSLSTIQLALAVVEIDPNSINAQPGLYNNNKSPSRGTSPSPSTSTSTSTFQSASPSKQDETTPSSSSSSSTPTNRPSFQRTPSVRKLRFQWPPPPPNHRESTVSSLSLLSSPTAAQQQQEESAETSTLTSQSTFLTPPPTPSGASLLAPPALARNGSDEKDEQQQQQQQQRQEQQQQEGQDSSRAIPLPELPRPKRTTIQETIELYENINVLRRRTRHQTLPLLHPGEFDCTSCPTMKLRATYLTLDPRLQEDEARFRSMRADHGHENYDYDYDYYDYHHTHHTHQNENQNENQDHNENDNNDNDNNKNGNEIVPDSVSVSPGHSLPLPRGCGKHRRIRYRIRFGTPDQSNRHDQEGHSLSPACERIEDDDKDDDKDKDKDKDRDRNRDKHHSNPCDDCSSHKGGGDRDAFYRARGIRGYGRSTELLGGAAPNKDGFHARDDSSHGDGDGGRDAFRSRGIRGYGRSEEFVGVVPNEDDPHTRDDSSHGDGDGEGGRDAFRSRGIRGYGRSEEFVGGHARDDASQEGREGERDAFRSRGIRGYGRSDEFVGGHARDDASQEGREGGRDAFRSRGIRGYGRSEEFVGGHARDDARSQEGREGERDAFRSRGIRGYGRSDEFVGGAPNPSGEDFHPRRDDSDCSIHGGDGGDTTFREQQGIRGYGRSADFLGGQHAAPNTERDGFRASCDDSGHGGGGGGDAFRARGIRGYGRSTEFVGGAPKTEAGRTPSTRKDSDSMNDHYEEEKYLEEEEKERIHDTTTAGIANSGTGMGTATGTGTGTGTGARPPPASVSFRDEQGLQHELVPNERNDEIPDEPPPPSPPPPPQHNEQQDDPQTQTTLQSIMLVPPPPVALQNNHALRGFRRPDVWITPLPSPDRSRPTWIAKRVWDVEDKDDAEPEYEVDHSCLMEGVRGLMGIQEPLGTTSGEWKVEIDEVDPWSTQADRDSAPNVPSRGLQRTCSTRSAGMACPSIIREHDTTTTTRSSTRDGTVGFRDETGATKSSKSDSSSSSSSRGTHHRLLVALEPEIESGEEEEEDDWEEEEEEQQQQQSNPQLNDRWTSNSGTCSLPFRPNQRGFGRPDSWVRANDGDEALPRSPWRSSEETEKSALGSPSPGEGSFPRSLPLLGDSGDSNERSSVRDTKATNPVECKMLLAADLHHCQRGFGRPDSWVRPNDSNEALPRSPWRSSEETEKSVFEFTGEGLLLPESLPFGDSGDSNEIRVHGSKATNPVECKTLAADLHHCQRGFGRPDSWVRPNDSNEALPRSPWRRDEAACVSASLKEGSFPETLPFDDARNKGHCRKTRPKHSKSADECKIPAENLHHSQRGFGRPDSWVRPNDSNEALPRSPWRSDDTCVSPSLKENSFPESLPFDDATRNKGQCPKTPPKSCTSADECKTPVENLHHSQRGFGRPDSWVRPNDSSAALPRSPWRSDDTCVSPSPKEMTLPKSLPFDDTRDEGQCPKTPSRASTSADECKTPVEDKNHSQRGFGRPDSWVRPNDSNETLPSSPWRSKTSASPSPEERSYPESLPLHNCKDERICEGHSSKPSSITSTILLDQDKTLAMYSLEDCGNIDTDSGYSPCDDNEKEQPQKQTKSKKKKKNKNNNKNKKKNKNKNKKNKTTQGESRAVTFDNNMHDTEEEAARGTPTWEKKALQTSESPSDIKLWWQC